MAKFYSTKTYGNDRGLSCCFRQWRSTHSHCSLLHGYSIGIKLIFECDTLDDNINLFGFDLHSPTEFVNNIYKNTANYADATKPAVDPRYWIYQIAKVFECFPDKYFVVFNNTEWQMPNSWLLANVKFKTIDSIM